MTEKIRPSGRACHYLVQDSNSTPKLGWTLNELARSLSVSVPFLRLEVKRGRLRAAHLGRRVVVLDTEVRRYLAEASVGECSRR
jgi:excisionase family DNA binding protein